MMPLPYDDYGDAPETETSEGAASLNDIIKELQKVENYTDASFEELVKVLGDSKSLLNSVDSLRIADLAKISSPKAGQDGAAVEQSFKREITDRLNSGISSDIIEQLNGAFVPKDRLSRYKSYDDLHNELYLAARVIDVYMDNILVKNPYTKQFIDISGNEERTKNKTLSENDIEAVVDVGKIILSYFQIQKRLKNDIIPNQLKYGNFFVEVVNLRDIRDLNQRPESVQVLLQEFDDKDPVPTTEEISEGGYRAQIDIKSFDRIKHIEESAASVAKITRQEQIRRLFESKYLDSQSQILYEDVSNSLSDQDKVNMIRDLDLTVLQDISIEYISPRNVILLKYNGIDYGCLVIDESKKQGSDTSYMKVTGKGEEYDFLSAYKNKNNNNLTAEKVDGIKQSEELVKKMVNKIYRNIINTVKVANNEELLNTIESDGTRRAIENLIYEKYKDYAELKIRYIPPQKIINFTGRVDKYSPYGTSVLDNLILPGRMYLLGLVSSIISRLNRASIIRKWTLDVGSRKNHSEIVEKFKRELRNRTITVDDILSKSRDIANLISDYDDVITVQQNGKRYVDFELMPLHDRNLPLQELQQLKDELISASGIPSIYLGENTVDLRETLVQTNIMFANLIDTLQSNINDSLIELVDTIFAEMLRNNGIDPDSEKISLTYFVQFKMVPPLLLVLQHLEGTVSSVTNLINLLANVGIQTDPVSLLKRFVNIINWETIVSEGERFLEQKQVDQLAQGTTGGGQPGMY